MLLTAHILRMLLLPSAGSSLLYSLCGQIVIQRMASGGGSVVGERLLCLISRVERPASVEVLAEGVPKPAARRGIHGAALD